MNFLKRILFAYIFLNVVNSTVAQNTSFEKIEYASFEVISKPKCKDSIRIGLYYNVDKTGLVTILNDDDYHNTLTFDTYQLSTTQLKKLNSIFNYTRHLKNFMVRKKLDSDEFFQGAYKFVSVVYRNGCNDNLCFIVPFMSNDFQDAYHMLDSIYWTDKKKLKKRHSFIVPEYFKKAVELSYKKSSLPKKKSIPSFRVEDQ